MCRRLCAAVSSNGAEDGLGPDGPSGCAAGLEPARGPGALAHVGERLALIAGEPLGRVEAV
jgi:hypothetical protein